MLIANVNEWLEIFFSFLLENRKDHFLKTIVCMRIYRCAVNIITFNNNVLCFT